MEKSLLETIKNVNEIILLASMKGAGIKEHTLCVMGCCKDILEDYFKDGIMLLSKEDCDEICAYVEAVLDVYDKSLKRDIEVLEKLKHILQWKTIN